MFIYRAFRWPVRKFETLKRQELIGWAEAAANQGNYTEAAKRWKQVIKMIGANTSPGTHFQLASSYIATGDYAAAESVLESAKKRFPEHHQLEILSIRLAIISGDYPRSIELWWRAGTKYNGIVKQKYWAELSRLYRNNGRFKEATEIIEDGLADYPDNYDLLVEYAEIAYQNDDYQLALDRWEKLLEYIELDGSIRKTSLKFTKARMNISILSRLVAIDSFAKQIKEHAKAVRKARPENRVVIYSCISGRYDTLKIPEVLNPNFDYVLFTDQPISGLGIFDVRPLPYFHIDPTRSARYVKTHPHILLPEYDTAIWIDASIITTSDLSPLVERFHKSSKALGVIPHPDRHSVYQEAEACLKLNKDEGSLIQSQIQHYVELGFKGRGLVESGFMMFDLNNKMTTSFLNCWWREIDTYSKRDQLSLSFALEEVGVKPFFLMQRPNNVRNSEDFILVPHGLDDTISTKLSDELFVLSKGKEILSPRVSRKTVTTPSIDVVVCVHNALDEVKRCLESIVRNRSSDAVSLVIVDDGSDEQTAKYLRRFVSSKEWASLLRNEQATGYTKAANKGMAQTSGDMVILLNSDTVTTKNWTDKLSTALFSHHRGGIVGPLSSAASHQSIPDHISKNQQTAINELPPGVSIEGMNRYCEKWAKDEPYTLVPLAHGFCFGVSRELINTIGNFDETNFPRGYGEENDYCFRAINAGFSIVIATNTYIFHAKSKSYKDNVRVGLMRDGSAKLKELHTAPRIERAVLTMQKNPLLIKMREKAALLYDDK